MPEPITQADNSKAQKKDYILLTGKHVEKDLDTGELMLYQPGEKVPLTEKQFKEDFKDKFAEVDDAPKKAAIFSPSTGV